jgi:hypothetical protein
MDKADAQRALHARRDLPVVDAVYRHTKGGLYVPTSVGILEDLHDLLREVGVPEDVVGSIEDTGLVLVSYRSNARNTYWVRTLRNFQESIPVQREGSTLITDTLELVTRFRRELQ